MSLDYPYIRAWEAYMGSLQPRVDAAIARAAEDGALQTAIYEIPSVDNLRTHKWRTIDEVVNCEAAAACDAWLVAHGVQPFRSKVGDLAIF